VTVWLIGWVFIVGGESVPFELVEFLP
jgi:hypothetical protein